MQKDKIKIEYKSPPIQLFERAKNEEAKNDSFVYGIYIQTNKDFSMFVLGCDALGFVAEAKTIAGAVETLRLKARYYFTNTYNAKKALPPPQTEFAKNTCAALEYDIISTQHNKILYNLNFDFIKDVMGYDLGDKAGHKTMGKLHLEEFKDQLALNSTKESTRAKAIRINKILKDNKFAAKVINSVVGAQATRFEIKVSDGVPIRKIFQYQDAIACEIAGFAPVRMLAPMPGKKVAAIEAANYNREIVELKDILDSEEFKNHKSPLAFAVGKDIDGNAIIGDLKTMPHLLVAGMAGSGKSTFLHSLIMSLLTKSPDDIKLAFVDIKKLEFGLLYSPSEKGAKPRFKVRGKPRSKRRDIAKGDEIKGNPFNTLYQNLPHMIANKPISEHSDYLSLLESCVDEMERRYSLFKDEKAKNIDEYNQKLASDDKSKKLPHIVIIIDEIYQLPMWQEHKKDFEQSIIKLAQKSRAAGIHMVLATQKSSADILSGVIRTNIPSRIAFMTKDAMGSRVIIDEGGAESLCSRGDMLYYPVDAHCPTRVQGAYIGREETEKVLEYIKQNNTSFIRMLKKQGVKEFSKKALKADKANYPSELDYDEQMPNIVKAIAEIDTMSSSFIQRRFFMGYARAARIMDWLEEHNFIGSFNGIKPRDVYITPGVLEKYSFDELLAKIKQQKIRELKKLEIKIDDKEDNDDSDNNDDKDNKDDKNAQLTKSNAPKITVVGIGGCGCNMVRGIAEGFKDIKTVAICSDLKILDGSNAGTRILIGDSLAKGNGCGADPRLGERAALESSQVIKDELKGNDMVFILAGLGGGTGGGATPIAAKIAKELGIFTVAIATMPFAFEGNKRGEQAQKSLAELKKSVDAILVMPNEVMLTINPKLKMADGFGMVNKQAQEAIIAIANLIAVPSMINIDLADIKSILQGESMFGSGRASGSDRVKKAVEQAISSLLMGEGIKQSKNVILSITGSSNMQLDETMEVSNIVKELIDPTARIVFGCDIDDKLGDEIVVIIIASKEGG